MTVRFGQDSPLDQPGGYRYEVSEADRKIFEQAVRDSRSPDAARQAAAREGLLSGLKAGGGIWNDAVVWGVEKVLNFLGFGVMATMDQSGGVVVEFDGYQVASLNWDEPRYGSTVGVRSATATPSSGYLFARINASIVARWSYDFRYGYEHRWQTIPAVFGIGRFRESDGQFDADMGKVGSPRQTADGTTFQTSYTVNDSTGRPPDPDYDSDVYYEPFAQMANGYYYRMMGETTHRDEAQNVIKYERKFFGPEMRIGDAPGDFDGAPELEDMEELPNELDPANSDLTPTDMQNLINELKDPAGPYADYIGNPEDDPGDVRIPGEPPQEDFPPGEEPPLSGSPFDRLRLNDGIGKSPQARLNVPWEDPLGDRFKPGEPFRVTPPGGGSPFDGKIDRWDPGAPGGGEIIGSLPPYGDERFGKTRCYKNALATDIAKELAGELGVSASIVVSPGCTKRFTGCFKKGSSKWDAMWRMADLCGYGVFPDPDTPGIAPIEPLDVHHGPYHEHRDLFVFEPVFDSLDIPRWVSYYRPPAIGKPGSGYEVMVEVVTPYSLPDDKIERVLAPPGASQSEAADAAAKKAASYQRKATVVDIAVPLKMGIKTRHQVSIKRPSMGYDGNFMVWELEHDADPEGFVTKIKGVELSRTRYTPRFETYAEVFV